MVPPCPEPLAPCSHPPTRHTRYSLLCADCTLVTLPQRQGCPHAACAVSPQLGPILLHALTCPALGASSLLTDRSKVCWPIHVRKALIRHEESEVAAAAASWTLCAE